MRQVGSGAVPSEEASATFSAAVAGLRSCQDQVRQIRPELCFEEMPAPRTLAPFATAVGPPPLRARVLSVMGSAAGWPGAAR